MFFTRAIEVTLLMTLMTTIGCTVASATPLTQSDTNQAAEWIDAGLISDVIPDALPEVMRTAPVEGRHKKLHQTVTATSRNDIGSALHGDRTPVFPQRNNLNGLRSSKVRGAAVPPASSPLAAAVTPMPITTIGGSGGAANRRTEPIVPASLPLRQQVKSNKLVADCPKCAAAAAAASAKGAAGSKLVDEEYRNMHIEEIKTQILKKLRMTSRPNTTIPRSMLPTPLIKGGFAQHMKYEIPNRDIDDFYGKTEQVIVMAELADYPTCNTDHHDPAACFFFNLSDDVSGRKIASAELWAFKLRDPRDIHNQTYHVTEIVRDSSWISRRVKVVSIRETSVKDGWIKFDITTTIQRWHSGGKEHGLEISCKTCAMDLAASPVSNDPGERPFIIIHLNTQPVLRRQRRNLSCTANTTQCCKETLYVSFADIGWNDWIIEPAGYMANYCRGSCIEDVTNNRNHHTTVIQQLIIQNKINLTESQLATIAPCCTPTRMSAINLLYTDDSGRIIINLLPNMVVEACACY